MIRKMSSKINLATIVLGGFTSGLFEEALTKIIMTCIAMLVATTVSFYWRKRLEHIEKSREKKRKELERLEAEASQEPTTPKK